MILDDTIAALASPPGPSLRGIVRLSGPRVREVLADWFVPDDVECWRTARLPRRHPGQVYLPGWRAPVIGAVHLWPTSRSYTGQPLAELHLPGSPPLLEIVLQTAFAHVARPARPGEFTLRAFLAGRLDLLQAEAVLGVIDATDDRELAAALGQLAGGVSHRLARLRGDLLELLADLEAGLDFVEEHLEFVSRTEIAARMTAAAEFVDGLLAQVAGRMHAGDVPRVVLAGLPNAGKSTLFNALARTDAALVSPVAGTTRDYLSATIQQSGQQWELIDTAGWDTAVDPVTHAMQWLRSDQLQRADLIVWCTRADATAAERTQDAKLYANVIGHVLPVVTKADRGADRNSLAVSAQTGAGLTALRERIAVALNQHRTAARQWIGSTAARCQESLRAAAEALHRGATAAADPRSGEELIAVELRSALDDLGAIVGTVYTDDLLDRIFSKFCIGK